MPQTFFFASDGASGGGVHMHDAVRIGTCGMDGAVNDKTGPIDLPCGALAHISFQINGHQVVGGDLGVMQSKGVDQVFGLGTGSIRQANRDVIEDQLVRADLIVISGERKDDSFDLITRTLSGIGEITTIDLAIESSGRHNYGTIGPDKVPVVTLPGDPIAAYISFELFIRPMIRTMLGASTIHRPSVKAKLERPVTSPDGQRSYVRGVLSEDGKSIVPLGKGDSSAQDEQTTLSDANAFIAVPEGVTTLETGADVTVVVLERRYI